MCQAHWPGSPEASRQPDLSPSAQNYSRVGLGCCCFQTWSLSAALIGYCLSSSGWPQTSRDPSASASSCWDCGHGDCTVLSSLQPGRLGVGRCEGLTLFWQSLSLGICKWTGQDLYFPAAAAMTQNRGQAWIWRWLTGRAPGKLWPTRETAGNSR